MSKRIVELGKDLLIVLLALSALFLARSAGYESFVKERLAKSDAQSTTASGAESESVRVEIRPFVAVVNSAEGTHCAESWTDSAQDGIYEVFSAPLGEALGSSGEAEEIDEEQWRAVLKGSSVFFDFYYSIPLDVLSRSLGISAGGAGAHSASMAVLGCAGDGAVLCFADSDGLFYRCSTAVSASSLLGRMEPYRRDNASYVFENAALGTLSPYTVITNNLSEHLTVGSSASNGAGFDTQELFALLNINSYVVNPYTEADGTKVYVEGRKTLRIASDGTVSYKNSVSSYDSADSLADALDAAERFAYATVGDCCGDASLCLSGVRSDGKGSVSVQFQYSLGGVPVELPGGECAAEISISGGEITLARLYPRSYALSDTPARLMPMLQAAAAASIDGGELHPAYVDSGTSVECIWVK